MVHIEIKKQRIKEKTEVRYKKFYLNNSLFPNKFILASLTVGESSGSKTLKSILAC